jgi:SPP1 family holin
MDNGTKLRTALAIATSLNTALIATDLTGFRNETVDTIYKIVSIVLNFIVVALVTYFNNDYTETASQYTGEMRQKKLEQSENYDGEVFFDDEEDEDDDEIEEVADDEE